MSKVTHVLVYIMCSHHVFVLLVQFALVHLKNILKVCLALPETGVAFLQEDYRTHQFASIFFLEIDV